MGSLLYGDVSMMRCTPCLQNSRYLVSPPPQRDSDEDDTDSVDSDEDEPPRRRRNSAFKRAVRKIISTRVGLQNRYFVRFVCNVLMWFSLLNQFVPSFIAF